MRWKKLGVIFCPENQWDWMFSHAANPVAEFLHDDLFRIYFSCRDQMNRSSIAYIDINIMDPFRIITISTSPVISYGIPGCFDDSGASMGCIVKNSDKRYLYYLGWNLGMTVPWRNSIGLATQESTSNEFKRYSPAPIVDRHHVDPFSISYPWVLCDEGKWKMWYGSNLTWGKEQADMAHVIKYAESHDGIHWHREGNIAINFQNQNEYALSKPCILKEGGTYKMWYSYRGNHYRIGYAESTDGIFWIRKDNEVGIDVSSKGWDSDSIAYPCVFDHKGLRYMLYNGNGYGKTGFGIAVLE